MNKRGKKRARKPETREQRDKRNRRAVQVRANMTHYYDQLMDTLGILDHRHKAAPPRDELLDMAIKRIIQLRQDVARAKELSNI